MLVASRRSDCSTLPRPLYGRRDMAVGYIRIIRADGGGRRGLLSFAATGWSQGLRLATPSCRRRSPTQRRLLAARLLPRCEAGALGDRRLRRHRPSGSRAHGGRHIVLPFDIDEPFDNLLVEHYLSRSHERHPGARPPELLPRSTRPPLSGAARPSPPLPALQDRPPSRPGRSRPRCTGWRPGPVPSREADRRADPLGLPVAGARVRLGDPAHPRRRASRRLQEHRRGARGRAEVRSPLGMVLRSRARLHGRGVGCSSSCGTTAARSACTGCVTTAAISPRDVRGTSARDALLPGALGRPRLPRALDAP